MDADTERERVLCRLRCHYNERTPLYIELARLEGQIVLLQSCRRADGAITFLQLQRLMRAATREYYDD